MAERRARSRIKERSRQLPLDTQRAMTDRIHTGMDTVDAPPFEPSPNAPGIEPTFPQLRSRHDSPLALRQLLDANFRNPGAGGALQMR